MEVSHLYIYTIGSIEFRMMEDTSKIKIKTLDLQTTNIVVHGAQIDDRDEDKIIE